jgi:hypothetical protein
MTHCWKDYRTHLEETGKIYSAEWGDTYISGNMTCMREKDHEGDHEFVDDGSIVVVFKGEEVCN